MLHSLTSEGRAFYFHVSLLRSGCRFKRRNSPPGSRSLTSCVFVLILGLHGVLPTCVYTHVHPCSVVPTGSVGAGGWGLLSALEGRVQGVRPSPRRLSGWLLRPRPRRLWSRTGPHAPRLGLSGPPPRHPGGFLRFGSGFLRFWFCALITYPHFTAFRLFRRCFPTSLTSVTPRNLVKN